ncbi:hypothetical protein [Priestia megaterium]|uniref:hypothetical protein n=1 Tax=Priestia megaterium TaxID=1404 RepID=UPI000BF66486|nr:hypothetical protein [Priestia megaterium]PFK78869.1 hypothetical protein COJ21_03640 [Priestia megaterium]
MFDFDFTHTGTTSRKYTFQFDSDDFKDEQAKRIKELIKKDQEVNEKLWHAKSYLENQTGEFADAVKSKLEAAERGYTLRAQQYDTGAFQHIMSFMHSVKDMHKREYEIRYKESMDESELT